MTYKNPRIEDNEYCINGTHLWILLEFGIYCYNCGIDFKERDKKRKRKLVE